MKQRDKYCTPEQSEMMFKLAEIKTGRYWYTSEKDVYELYAELINVRSDTARSIPAFDIPEIMSILPTEIETDKGTAVLWIHRTEDKEYEAGYVYNDCKFTV